jgi:hypothetical protein
VTARASRPGSFSGALVDQRLADPDERDRLSVLRQLGAVTRRDRLFEPIAGLHDVVVVHDAREGARCRAGAEVVRHAVVRPAAPAVAVEAAQLWPASTERPGTVRTSAGSGEPRKVRDYALVPARIFAYASGECDYSRTQ